MQMTQPHQERGEESPSEGMKDMAETIKIMFETMRDMAPQREEGLNSDLKEVLTEIKRGQEELRDKYYSLQLAQLEGKGGGGEGLSKEDLDEIIEKRLQNLNKSPKDALKEIKDTILAVDELRDTMSGEAPEQQEPLDTWVKKHTMQREAEGEKAAHEMKIKELEAKAAKWGTAKTLLQDGIRANLLKMGESKKEEGVPELEPEIRAKRVQLVK
jgi:flagellar biosynthesis chaperone FliJ